MPPIPELDRPLSDGRVALRDAAERDIPEILIAHEDDPQMYVRLGLPHPPSGAELGRQMELAPAERASGRRARLTILERGSDDCRGRVLVHNVDWESARAELGLWVVPQLRGTGVGRIALRLGAGWLFETCGFQRLQVLTEPANTAMLRAAAGAGFVHEGVLRAYHREHDGRRDMIVLSLLPADLGQAR